MEVGAAAGDDGGFGAAAVDDVYGDGNHRAAVSEGGAAAGGATAGRTNDGHDNIEIIDTKNACVSIYLIRKFFKPSSPFERKKMPILPSPYYPS